MKTKYAVHHPASEGKVRWVGAVIRRASSLYTMISTSSARLDLCSELVVVYQVSLECPFTY